MKTSIKNIKQKLSYLTLSIMTAGLLWSCDSGLDVAGVGGTGIVSGTITGFGSVYVNGIKFETDNSQFEIDGSVETSQANLRIGMVVTIKGTINADGVTGTAESLTYDDSLEGPISSTVTGSDNQKKELSILGYTIIIDALTTHYDNTSFSDLALNDVVEISGYNSSAPNTIVATLVKKTGSFTADSTVVELKGTISNLTATTFNLNTLLIHYSPSTDLELDDAQLSENMFVEVEGILQSDGSINADEIEQESNSFSSEDGEISLSGTISEYNSSSDFKINGQAIDASNAQELSPSYALSLLADGVSVEVEGSIVNAVLVADEVEVKLKNIKIAAKVNSVSSNGLIVEYPNSIGTINIVTNNSTQLEDESSAEMDPFVLSDIIPTNFVEIEATLINNDIVATQIQRDEPEDTVLQGKLDSVGANNTSITILGLTYPVDGSTDYDGFANAAEFFGTDRVGEVIKIKDEDTDGIADKVKLAD